MRWRGGPYFTRLVLCISFVFSCLPKCFSSLYPCALDIVTSPGAPGPRVLDLGPEALGPGPLGPWLGLGAQALGPMPQAQSLGSRP